MLFRLKEVCIKIRVLVSLNWLYVRVNLVVSYWVMLL